MQQEITLSFGQLLRKQRKSAGFSLKNLAAKAEFSASYLSLLENNRRQPSMKAIKQLAAVLGLNTNEFQAMRLAAGFEAFTKALVKNQPLSFLHFLLKLYVTTVQSGFGDAQSLIMEAFGVYQHPVCLQILLAFLEAVRSQKELSQRAFALSQQAYLIQSDIFDESVCVYAELLLQMVNQPALSREELERFFVQIDSLPDGSEKTCLCIFVYALVPESLDLLAKKGENLLCSEVPAPLLLIRQAALLIWLEALKSSQDYQLLFQKSLAAMRAFAPEHPLLLQLNTSA